MSLFALEKRYALQMPNNYVDIESDEMEYIEGGWSWKTLGNNLKGIYRKFSSAKKALIGSGISFAVITAVGLGHAKSLYWKIAGVLGKVALANWAIGIAIGVTAGAAMWAMGTWRIF